MFLLVLLLCVVFCCVVCNWFVFAICLPMCVGCVVLLFALLCR